MKYQVKVFPTEQLIHAVAESPVPLTVYTRAGKSNAIQCDRIEILSSNSTGRRIRCKFTWQGSIIERVVYREWVIRAWEKFNVDWPYDE